MQSWYFDLTMVMNYWGKERTYHHTPPIPLIYALHEALRIVHEEGLEASWERHRQNQIALIAGLEAMGIGLFVENRSGPSGDGYGGHCSCRHRRSAKKGVRPVAVCCNDFNIEISVEAGLVISRPPCGVSA